jgi:AraC-like DNA-binding protein
MNYKLVLLIISAITISHCIYLSVSLRLISNRTTNKLLALLLLLLAVRTGKSVISLLVPDSDYFAAVAGGMAIAATGPVLLFLIQRTFGGEVPLRKREFIHFIPLAFNLSLLAFKDWYWVNLLYYLFTISLAGYCVYSAFYLWKNKVIFSPDDISWKWSWMIIGAIFLLCLSFTIQLIFYDPLVYTLNVSIAALLVYGLSIYSFRHARLFQPVKRKQGSTQDYKDIVIRIQLLFEQHEIFADPDLTISKLAGHLKLPPYLVSKAINQNFQCSFPEFLSGFRLKKAENLLIIKSEMLSIEGIAYECGYNSLSSFYASFKKMHKMTPAEFRNRNIDRSSMKIA